MIKRSTLTVYNAQEADTFGKDAEAGVTLAQKKPVIVYVARLFEESGDLKELYDTIDDGARLDKMAFIRQMKTKGFLEGDDAESLLAPEKTKSDVVTRVVENRATHVLRRLEREDIAAELIRQGYEEARNVSDVIEFAVRKILRLEKRALTFREVHPLSLQTSPTDGVARGVMVARSVKDTAKLVEGVLLGTLEYEIKDDADNFLLLEKISRSAVRVVTKDPLLTTAFWTEDWF